MDRATMDLLRREMMARQAQLGFDPRKGPPQMDDQLADTIQKAFGPNSGMYEAFDPNEIRDDYSQHMRGEEVEGGVPPGQGLADYIATQLNVEEIQMERDGVFGEEKERALSDITDRIREATGLNMVRDQHGNWQAAPEGEVMASSRSRFVKLSWRR